MSLLLLLTAVLLPQSARADEPTLPPESFNPDLYPPPAARGRVLLAGAGVLLGGYTMALGGSYLWSDAPTASDLRIPVAGPVLAVAGAGCSDAEPTCDVPVVVVRTVFATLAGIGQIGGLGVLLEGVVMKTSRPTRSGSAWANRKTFVVSPSVNASSFGLSVAGRF